MGPESSFFVFVFELEVFGAAGGGRRRQFGQSGELAVANSMTHLATSVFVGGGSISLASVILGVW